VANPVLLTVATCVSLEDHVAVLVRLISPPPTNVPKATNCVVCPICGIVGLLGRTVMDCKTPPVQVLMNVVCPMMPPTCALIVVVPQPTAVARPVEETVATPGVLDDQATPDVRTFGGTFGWLVVPIA
jgi:hypothetical protein